MGKGVLGGDYWVFGGGDGSWVPPYGPGRSCQQALPVPRTLRNAASGPIRARIQYIYRKVSQNGQVSPKYPQKASHSPCFHFSLRKSPLEIPRFPILAAFSHKELMAHFAPGSRFIVKTTKCRQCAHP